MRVFRAAAGPTREVPAEGPASDAALLRAVAAGDADALADFYDRHAGWLHVRLTRRCADAETVSEVLQDTFVAVWRTAGSFRAGASGEAGGWLWTIAARRLVDAQRAAVRATRPRDTAMAPELSAEEHVLAHGLEFGDMGAALDRISPELRMVLRATVIDGLTVREAALHLGIPEGTVKTRSMRARRELRAALGALGARPLGGTA
ncbi:RNA polymerase sigma factor [Streptomyces sp. 3N207]|uniref:RNA polymerase sigma factor n=1 Tax=Streptomyces sp. 3N207 TaxID=3457417 RepID=UPI003FD4D36F